MCTLALYFHVFPQYPIVVAANRDESLARPSSPPVQLWPSPWIYGGQDLLAGGTWLGVNERGVVAAILNRHTPDPTEPHRRSRGLLCLDALKHTSAATAIQSITAQPAVRYNPFNLLVADPSAAYVVYTLDHTFQVHHLTPGVHLLTNLDLNDPECPRIARSFQRFLRVSQDLSARPTPLSDLCAQLHLLLADHDTPLDPRAQDPRNGLCVHLAGYGTCSSTVLAYSRSEDRYAYFFAPGPPCHNTYREVPVPSGVLTSHPPSTR
jgi:uncharacterized protein with NRDE domain